MFHYVLVLYGLGHTFAQLLVQPVVDDLEKLLDEQADLLQPLSKPKNDTGVQPGLRQPSLCDPSVKQHSGLLDAGHATKYFFWMFESRSKPSTDPLVIWLTGGPGCSSQLALFAENGPCWVNQDGRTTSRNPHSWNAEANVLWLDQPQNTGFSIGPIKRSDNESDTAEHFYAFLMNFYKTFPQYKKLDLFISGESYAGHYVPAVAHRVWMGGAAAAPLKGILIGNGMVDPEEQYKWYHQMAKDGGKSEGGTLTTGFIRDIFTLGGMQAGIRPCTTGIHQCNDYTSLDQEAACSRAFYVCNVGQLYPYHSTGHNLYDMRIKCQNPPLCYDFSPVESFLNTPEVQMTIGATKRWTTCNFAVNSMFRNDFLKGYHIKIPDLLRSGIRVMIYAGDVDYICNWLGNKHWALALDWEHKAEFNAAEDKPYMSANGTTQIGRMREAGGFSFVQIYQAGHMVPLDQPEVALMMLSDFLAKSRRRGETTSLFTDSSSNERSESVAEVIGIVV